MQFYGRVIDAALATGRISSRDKVLVVCGGRQDRDNFLSRGFHDVTISNLNDFMSDGIDPFRWRHIDAEHIDAADGSFDIVAVHGGLHHCRSPHLALLEMCRVARKCVIAIEARDSLSMRLAVRLGLTADYEIEAVTGSRDHGGFRGGPVPNFIYRWTENEVRKTLATAFPIRPPVVDFHYGLLLPSQRFAATRRSSLALAILAPFANLLAKAFPGQGNRFGWVAWKDAGERHAWLDEADELALDRVPDKVYIPHLAA